MCRADWRSTSPSLLWTNFQARWTETKTVTTTGIDRVGGQVSGTKTKKKPAGSSSSEKVIFAGSICNGSLLSYYIWLLLFGKENQVLFKFTPPPQLPARIVSIYHCLVTLDNSARPAQQSAASLPRARKKRGCEWGFWLELQGSNRIFSANIPKSKKKKQKILLLFGPPSPISIAGCNYPFFWLLLLSPYERAHAGPQKKKKSWLEWGAGRCCKMVSIGWVLYRGRRALLFFLYMKRNYISKTSEGYGGEKCHFTGQPSWKSLFE